jgi:AmmeMemoRadiSam system protein A
METGTPTPTRPPAGNRLPTIARDAVASALAGTSAVQPRFPSGDLTRRGGVFVTVRERTGRLRGCVGTLSPKFRDVAEETWRMAREAAFHDSRFPPVTPDELSELRFEVSVVHPPEAVADTGSLDATRYGVVVSTPDGRRGALLPAVEGIDTVAEQLAVARRKGAISPTESIRIQRFTVEKFRDPDDLPPALGGVVVTGT